MTGQDGMLVGSCKPIALPSPADIYQSETALLLPPAFLMSKRPVPSEFDRLLHLHEKRKKRPAPPNEPPPPRGPPRKLLPALGLGIAGLALTAGLAPWAQWFPSVFPPPAPNHIGMVTHVRDGDTIEVNGKPIRIANLDCAELGTTQGAAAHQALLELAAGTSVECTLGGRMSFDRHVGTCKLTGGADLGQIMVDKGLCTWWR